LIVWMVRLPEVTGSAEYRHWEWALLRSANMNIESGRNPMEGRDARM